MVLFSKNNSSPKTLPFENEYWEHLSNLFAFRLKLLARIAIVIDVTVILIWNMSDLYIPRIILRLMIIVFSIIALMIVDRDTSLYARKRLTVTYLLSVIIISSLLSFYSQYFFIFGTINYFILLFTFSFMFPWRRRDVTFIFLALLVSFVWVGAARGYENYQDYVAGSVLSFIMAYIICLFFTQIDGRRQKKAFYLQREIKEKNIRTERELALARDIHTSLMPQSIELERMHSKVNYFPMHYVGGDYGKIHFYSKDKSFLFISDVTGHGVPAALLVNRLHTEVERLLGETNDLGKILGAADRFIQKEFDGTGIYLSAFGCMLDFNKNAFEYAGYGHPDQYLINGGRLIALEGSNGLLGLPFNQEKPLIKSASFEKGDKIILFTDGVIEMRSKNKEEFGRERFEKFIADHHTLSAQTFSQNLVAEINQFQEGDATDDILIITTEMFSIERLAN